MSGLPPALRAHVVEVLDDGRTQDRGAFEFVAAPAAGDQIVVGAGAGALAVYRVNFIEHDPVRLPRAEGSPDARLTVFATKVGDVS